MNRMIRTFVTVIALTFTYNAAAQKDQPLGGEQINIAPNIETGIIAEPLDNRVNSKFIEYGPTLSKDGRRLYFSRQGHPSNTGGTADEDIWFSEFDDASQSWKDAINIGLPLNNTGPNFICGVGSNGDTLLLGNTYLKSGKMRDGLSITVRTGDTWSFPEAVWIENDYNMAEKVSFDVSNDRRALIIAQKKVDSKGGMDLYVSFRTANKKNPYSGKESINLGAMVNTPADETSPFLAYDNKTLYFASGGHNGYGKYDIFVTTRLDDTWQNWSKPENLGPGINTVYDDTFFGFTPRSRYAYYSRGLTSTNSDIYRLDMTYLFKPSDKSIGQMDELIDKAQIGQTLVLDSVFLDDQYEIQEAARHKLDYIHQYMLVYSNYVVMIMTHSNPHDSREISKVLSDARAVRIRDYLIEKGIEPHRLEYKGYGQDIVVNMDNLPTLKEMKKRVPASVEFRLVAYGKKAVAAFR